MCCVILGLHLHCFLFLDFALLSTSCIHILCHVLLLGAFLGHHKLWQVPYSVLPQYQELFEVLSV